MQQKKISVIIPVYNAKQYVEQCIRSVMMQTLRELEIIIVDDCGTDGSMDIVTKLAKDDDRITIIHNDTNQGIGESRNIGLRKASGECIYWMDHDDRLEPDAMKIAYTALMEHNADFVEFGTRMLPDGRAAIEQGRQESIITCGIQWLDSKERIIPEWSRLFSKNFLLDNNLFFEKLNSMEDFVFNLDVSNKIKKIIVIPDILYNHRVHGRSFTNGKITYKHIEAIIYSLYKTFEFIENNHLKHTKTSEILFNEVIEYAKTTMHNRDFTDIANRGISNIISDCVKSIFGDRAYMVEILLCKIFETHVNAVEYAQIQGSDDKSLRLYNEAKFCIKMMLDEKEIMIADKVLIYGTGNWAKNFFHILSLEGIDVVAFSDSNHNVWNQEVYSKNVISPTEIKNSGATKILIGSSKHQEIRKTLDEMGYKPDIDYIWRKWNR